MNKKILSFVLTLLMIQSCFVMAAFADGYPSFEDYFSYKSSYNAKDNLQSYVCTKTVTTTKGSGLLGNNTETTTNTYDKYGNVTKFVYSAKESSVLLSSTSSITNTSTYKALQLQKNVSSEKIDAGVFGTESSKTTSSYTYDKNGNITKVEKDMGSDGKSVTTYSYKSGKMIKSVEKTYEKNGKLSSEIKNTYTYDSAGRLTKSVEDGGTFGKTTETYTFDSKGRLIKSVSSMFIGNAEIKTTYTYTYDSKGNIKTEKSTSDMITSKISTTNTNTYDSKNRLTKYVTVTTTTEGKKVTKSTSTSTLKYDTKGNVTETNNKEVTGNKTYTTKTNYTYDKAGRVLTVKDIYDTEYSKGTSSETYKYDSKGNQVSYIYSVKDTDNTSKTTVTTTYDSKNRVVKKVTKIVSDLEGNSTETETYVYDAAGNTTEYKDVTKDEYGTTTISTKNSYKKLDKAICSIGDEDAVKIRLSGYSYTYDGKAKKPTVAIDNMLQGVDFTVSYKNCTNPGKAKLIITFADKGYVDNDKNSVTIYYEIKPAKVAKLKSTSVTKDSVKLSWAKDANATSYEVYTFSSSTGKYTKVADCQKNAVTVKKLKAEKTYKFSVRAVTKDGVKSSYCDTISVKTAK